MPINMSIAEHEGRDEEGAQGGEEEQHWTVPTNL